MPFFFALKFYNYKKFIKKQDLTVMFKKFKKFYSNNTKFN